MKMGGNIFLKKCASISGTTVIMSIMSIKTIQTILLKPLFAEDIILSTPSLTPFRRRF